MRVNSLRKVPAMADTATDNPQSDYAWGVPAIALEVRLPEKSVYHILEKKPGTLPAKKIAGKWVASRSRLRAALIGE